MLGPVLAALGLTQNIAPRVEALEEWQDTHRQEVTSEVASQVVVVEEAYQRTVSDIARSVDRMATTLTEMRDELGQYQLAMNNYMRGVAEERKDAGREADAHRKAIEKIIKDMTARLYEVENAVRADKDDGGNGAY